MATASLSTVIFCNMINYISRTAFTVERIKHVQSMFIIFYLIGN